MTRIFKKGIFLSQLKFTVRSKMKELQVVYAFNLSFCKIIVGLEVA